MKTVSTNFKTAWVNKGSKFAIQRIDYKRQYWNGAAMVYETNWNSLTMPKAQFKSIGTMSWSLDTILQNEFKESNCSLQLLNNDYRWSPNNSGGIFGADSVATSGYIAVGTKFQVYAGYELADGTFEYVSMFAGVLSDYSMKPVAGIFEAFISGYEYNLTNTDAQLVVNAVTNESIGPGNASKTAFTTTSTGIAFVDSVYVNGVLKVEGSDYTVGGLDTPSFGSNGPATISFLIAPGNGLSVTWSGRKWYAAQKIETLVTSLLTAAGFTAGQYSVQSVSFPNGVVSSFLLNTKSLFDSGATYNDTVAVSAGGAGSDYVKISCGVIDDFESGIGAWTQNGSSWVAGTGIAQYSASEGSPLGGYMTKASSKNTGMWILRFKPAFNSTIYYAFMSNSNSSTGNGYVIAVAQVQQNLFGSIFGKMTSIILYRSDSGVLTQLGSTFVPNSAFGGMSVSQSSQLVCAVMRDGSGNFSLFATNTGDFAQYSALNMATDTTYTTSSYVGMKVDWNPASAAGTRGAQVNDLFTYVSTDNTRPYAQYVTGEQNAVGITSWINITESGSFNNSTPTPLFDTEVSSVSGSGYDAYVNAPLIPATTNYAIGSATKQYLKAKMSLMFDMNDHVAMSGSQIFSLSIGYNTNQTTIALAVFRSMDCWSAIQQLAFVADYEIGFDSTGTFFFRAKNLNNTPLLSFKQSDILSQIVEIKPGWNEVLNDIQVTFGSSYGVTRGTSYKEYSYNSLPETRPSSYDKFRQRLNTQSVTNFLFSNDGNIALGMAQAIHDDNYQEKRRVTMVCRLIPQAEIGDIISVSHYEDPLLENNYFGDPLQTWAPIFGTPGNVALRAFKCKILQMAHDFDKQTTRILGLEVLT